MEHTLRKSMKLINLRPTRIRRAWSFNLGIDGDHQAKESNAVEEVKEVQRSVKEVKEIHAMVRNASTHNHSLLSSSTENLPSFTHLLQQGELGDFDGDLHPIQA